MSGDNEAEAASELGLLHQAECFCCSSHTKHVRESFFQNGLAHERLQRVVVHQENFQYPPQILPTYQAGLRNSKYL